MLRYLKTVSAAALCGVLTALSAQAKQVEPSFAAEATLEGRDVTLVMPAGAELASIGAALDASARERIGAAMASADFAADMGEALHLHGLAPYDTVTIIGAGEDPLTPRLLTELGGHIAALQDDDDDAVILAGDIAGQVDGAAWLAKGYAMRSYSFDDFQQVARDREEDPIDKPVFLSVNSDEAAARWQGDLAHMVEGITLARDLVTQPGNILYPQAFVDQVRGAFRGVANVRIEVLDARAIQREGMGALMGVGKGSIHDPRLLVVTYRGAGAPDQPISLVGKGVTFDTGGISIKGNDGMWRMKADMSGAAAVAGTVLAAAKRGAPVHVVGVMPLAENMPSQDAIRPGDVLFTRSGKTVEIISTDAEGRLLFIDAVDYTQDRHNPSLLVNLATLTGSAARAVGDDYTAMVTREFALSQEMMEIGERAGEDVWPLPLHPSHFTQIESEIADIKNTGGSPGASVAAAVVGTFIDDDQEWVHLDMAGVFWNAADTPTAPAGSPGWGVRFMDGILRERQEQ